MKSKIYKYAAMLAAMFALHACTLDNVQDPNFPSVASIQGNASKAQMDALLAGEFSLARNGMGTYLQVTGTLGKELFLFNGTESRWMTELNGLRPLDNSAFYNTATTGFGLPVRQANIILAAADKSTLLSPAQKEGYKGVANTFKGLAYLLMLNVQYQNGVRLSVEDPFKPSKPASYTESLAGIMGFLEAGATSLDAAGATLPMTLPGGFADFATPAKFKQFNRAIALRVAVYQKDWTKAAALLPATFVDEAAGNNVGPVNTYNAQAPDIINPLINTATASAYGLQKVFDDIESGDTRKSKVTVGPAVFYTNGLPSAYSSTYTTNIYNQAGNTSIPIIRNEELLLIKAEIAANQNQLAEADRVVNIIRTRAGLGVLATPSATLDQAITRILKERLYSLFYEGHRWVDMRRYNRLNQIDLPFPQMQVWPQLERPVQEVNWDKFNP